MDALRRADHAVLAPGLVGEGLEARRGCASQGAIRPSVTRQTGLCDRVAFLDAGRIIDYGPPRRAFHESRAPRAPQFLQPDHDRNSF